MTKDSTVKENTLKLIKAIKESKNYHPSSGDRKDKDLKDHVYDLFYDINETDLYKIGEKYLGLNEDQVDDMFDEVSLLYDPDKKGKDKCVHPTKEDVLEMLQFFLETGEVRWKAFEFVHPDGEVEYTLWPDDIDRASYREYEENMDLWR